MPIVLEVLQCGEQNCMTSFNEYWEFPLKTCVLRVDLRTYFELFVPVRVVDYLMTFEAPATRSVHPLNTDSSRCSPNVRGKQGCVWSAEDGDGREVRWSDRRALRRQACRMYGTSAQIPNRKDIYTAEHASGLLESWSKPWSASEAGASGRRQPSVCGRHAFDWSQLIFRASRSKSDQRASP